MEENTETTDAPQVVAQEAKQVGDDQIDPPRSVKVEVTKEQVPAQVAQPREADSDKANVHEVRVSLDEVITDPSDPRGLQVPDAGRGDSSLPIHRLSEPTPEEAFAKGE